MSDGNEGDSENELLSEVSMFLGVPIEKMMPVDSTVLSIIKARIQDFNKLKSQNIMLTVTIDEVKSASTKRSDTLKAEVERLIKENDVVRKERNDLSSKISELNSEQTQLNSDLEKSKGELKGFSERTALLQKDKQDMVKLIEEKISELQDSQRECDRFLNDNKVLRSQILNLENENQLLQSNELKNKSEIQVCTQKLDLLTKNNEWLEQEINSKNGELITFRHQSDTQLQKTLKEAAILRNDLHLEKTNKDVLIKKNEELSRKLQEKLLEVKDISDALTTEKNEFQREMTLKQRLIDLLEKQSGSLKEELKSALEKNISDSNSADEKSSLSHDKKQLTYVIDELEKKLETSEHERLRLESLVEDIFPNEEKSGASEGATLKISSSHQSGASRRLYADISVLKKQLIQERHQKENLQRQVESFIVELEHKIPMINSFKKRTSMLEKELNDVALLLEHTSTEKERKEKEYDSVISKVKKYESNVHELVRQRSDLAHQVQFLLLHVSVQSDENGPLTQNEISFIKKILNNENSDGDSDSQRVISERLLRFKDVVALQENNIELLKTVRNLADQLESQESSKASNNQVIENETIKEAKEAIVTLQTLNTKLESKLQTVEKEREAYKALLASSDGQNKQTAENSKLIQKEKDEEIIRHLEETLTSVKSEYSKNTQMLNEEIHRLYKSKSEDAIALEKERSSKQLIEERFKLAQNTVELAKNENSELHKRYQYLLELMASQDKRTADTMNDYVVCKTKVASLESKILNTETERNMLRSSDERIKEELKKSNDEKNTLKIMVTQLQTLQSERELMLQDVQRLHKENVRALEEAANGVREELNLKKSELKELEDSSKTKTKILEDKVESIREECATLREKLTVKTITINQLESEIKTLKRDLEESKRRISSFEVLNDTEDATKTEDNIRKDLERAKISLNQAYAQTEQYKELAAAAEDFSKNTAEELENVKNDLDIKLTSLDDEKKKLESTISVLQQQLEHANSECDLQRERFVEEKNDLLKKLAVLEANTQPLDEAKKEFESRISELKKSLEEQASYADKAQKNYEEELQKHADVSKTISELKKEANTYKLSVDGLRSAEEQARRTIEENEKSWLQQKTEFEAQLDASNLRIEDLSVQNKLLFDQVELLSKEDRGQEGRSSSDCQDILISLRRERDILETKFIVSDREAKLLNQKLTKLEHELQNARSYAGKLKDEEKNREHFAIEHEKIMEQLNQLNLLRESNITLRTAAQNADKECNELKIHLQSLQEKLLPLQAENESLHKTLREKDQQISLHKSEANRWRDRAQEILRKQERVDPEDYEKLVSEVSTLKSQLREITQENTDLDDRFSRLKKQAHEKLNASKIAQANLSAELSELGDKKGKLEETVEEQERKIGELESRLMQNTDNSAEIVKLQEELAATLTKSKDIEKNLQSTLSSSNELTAQLNEEIESLKSEVSSLKKKQAEQPPIIGNNDISNVVESMKQAFEKEKIEFIRAKTLEFNKNLAEQREELSIAKGVPSQSNQESDIEELKKKWTEEYEQTVQQRIQEAEDNLKKRIRMPTEERINKIIEKRKSELEEEYQSKLASFDEAKPSDVQDLEKKLEEKFENDLMTAKKRAFEEGKQQAAMKTTLLERKISKLETQLKEKEAPTDTATNMESTSHKSLSKIDERSNGAEKASLPPASGEQVLKLGGSPAFAFHSSKGNPFTSPFQKPALESSSVFGAKPTFDSPNAGNSAFGTFSPQFGADAQKPAFSLAPSSDAELQKGQDTSNGSDKGSLSDSKSNSSPSSPLKRPTEDETAEVTNERKKLKEASEGSNT